jgi:hypothetical protein
MGPWSEVARRSGKGSDHEEVADDAVSLTTLASGTEMILRPAYVSF